jgi:hypothetical protein
MIVRNPGVTLLWYTRRFTPIQSMHKPELGAHAGVLFQVGRAEKVEWYCQGRAATRAEVLESIESGLPLLYEANAMQFRDQPEQLEIGKLTIDQQAIEARKLVPR